MKLESLTIALRNPYSPAGQNNPYEARLAVSHNDTRMQVALAPETCTRILQLAGDEIAAAAQVQISTFVRDAIAIGKADTISGHLVGAK